MDWELYYYNDNGKRKIVSCGFGKYLLRVLYKYPLKSYFENGPYDYLEAKNILYAIEEASDNWMPEANIVVLYNTRIVNGGKYYFEFCD